MNTTLPMTRLDELKRQLDELEALISSGKLKGKGAKRARDKLEAQMVQALTASQAEADAALAAARPSKALVLGIAAFVVVFGVLGYGWRGNFDGWSVGPGTPPAEQADAGGNQHSMGQGQIEGLTKKLAERLQAQPDDAEGWSMLGRSYGVLGRFDDAVKAFRKLIELRPNDAQAYADAADAVGMAQGRKLAGEPEQLIAKALKLDPENPKALGLSGTIAFDKGDYKAAAKHWERALTKVEPDSAMAQQLLGAVNDARQRAGMAPLALPGAAPSAAAPAEPAPKAAAGSGAQVEVRISLAPALAAKANPEDPVFIFARAPDGGPKAPLAITRRQVKDLPLTLTLDESMAMSAATSLATQKQVVVGARISKSGSAMAQAGDLQGLSAKVDVGAKGVAIEIGEVVK